MGKNNNLANAKKAKNDEFYTQYSDIELEMNAYYEYDNDVFRDKVILCPCDDPEWSNFTKYFTQNFEKLGLKKLISTSYANGTANKHGKLYVIGRDTNGAVRIDIDDLDYTYLEGDGDFRSEEVTKLRDVADIIVTNPPFSLFREFLAWIMEGKKSFIIIGNQNAITYKEVFPLIKDNYIWLGQGFKGNVGFFESPYEDVAASNDHREGMIRVSGVMWFTNIDLSKRHESLNLMDMRQNLKFNKKLINKCNKEGWLDENGNLFYPKYDNYDAIEVPFTECIPSDYVPCWYECPLADKCDWAAAKGLDNEQVALCENKSSGCMGVPITYLDKHNPDDFEIIKFRKGNDEKDLTYSVPDNTFAEGEKERRKVTPYFRILIRQKKNVMDSWESQLPSSTNTARNNLRLLGSGTQETLVKKSEQSIVTPGQTENLLNGMAPQFTKRQCTSESLFAQKCNGVMGVPITFMDKYSIDQFEILECHEPAICIEGTPLEHGGYKSRQIKINGRMCQKTYHRIFIRQKEIKNENNTTH